jgi:hypothetical protein
MTHPDHWTHEVSLSVGPFMVHGALDLLKCLCPIEMDGSDRHAVCVHASARYARADAMKAYQIIIDAPVPQVKTC